jgi:NAD(P)-dependent dehydrogenase (short-subunit alcohol dehydrogenase family)
MDERPETVLVTGASSGLGQAMAIQLSATCRLVLNGRDAARLEETRSRCQGPERHLVWAYDLLDPEGAGADLAAFLDRHGVRVAGFVHAAALLHILPLRSLTQKMVQDGMAVGVLAPLALIRTLMQRKVNERRLRRIVFISSIASQFGAKGFAAYCAVKGAMDAMMKALAVELAPDVLVNSVLPGAIRTPMTEGIFQDPGVAAKLESDYPLGIGEPSDIAHIVEYLLSGKAKWVTGQAFVVDGGRTANITA